MNLHNCLKEIIAKEALTAFFQPIYATDKGEIYGYEALIRGSSNSPYHSPQVLFDAALEQALLSQLELVCRRISIARFAQLKLRGFLFINVSPMIFLQTDHPYGRTFCLSHHDVAELASDAKNQAKKVLIQLYFYHRELSLCYKINVVMSLIQLAAIIENNILNAKCYIYQSIKKHKVLLILAFNELIRVDSNYFYLRIYKGTV